jgi:hypothetical protein
MAKIIEATHRAAEQRERCLAEMAALKAHADREQSQFESEWQKLGATIDQDKRHRELLRQRDMEERNRKTQEVCFMSPMPGAPWSCFFVSNVMRSCSFGGHDGVLGLSTT